MRFLLLFLTLLCVGCDFRPHQITPQTVTDVRQVLISDESRYLLVLDLGSDKHSPSVIAKVRVAYPFDVMIFHDVPPGSAQWAYMERAEQDDNVFCTKLHLHMREDSKLDGAAWDYGKSGHGKTVPLE